jgi:hypothetical protein
VVFLKKVAVAANSRRENTSDGAPDVPTLSYASVRFPSIVLLALAAAFGLFVATYMTHRRARYRERLEDAYSRFAEAGPTRDTKATA